MPRNSNRPSNEELQQLVQKSVRYRSTAILARKLNISETRTRNMLINAGITPMNWREAQFARKGNLNPPSVSDIKKLIDDNPSYRNASLLSKRLVISHGATIKLLNEANIPVMGPREANFLRSGRADARTPTVDELKKLVEENPEFSHPVVLKDYLNVSYGTAGNYLRAAGIKPHPPTGFITTKEATELSGYTGENILYLINKGKIRSVSFNKNYLYISREDLDSYIKYDSTNRRFRIFQQFLETDEEPQQMIELAGDMYSLLDTEEERNAVIDNTEQAFRRRFSNREGYSQEERLYIGRKLNGGVVWKPSYNGKNPVDILTQAERIGIIGSETVGKMVGRMVAEGMQSCVRTPDEMIEELYQMKGLVS